MNFFRPQLATFLPHPHRDSWMRNRIQKWRKLLGIANLLLFLGYALLAMSKCIALINIIPETFSRSHFLAVYFVDYLPCVFALISVSVGFCCLRCVGKICRQKYAIPIVMGSAILLIEMLCAASVESPRGSLPPEDLYFVLTRIVFYFTPILQLFIYQFVNQLDYWNRMAVTVLSIFYLAHAAVILGLVDSSSYIENALSSLPFLKNYSLYTHPLVATLFIAPSLLVFLPNTRRLALYLFHIAALITIGLAVAGGLYEGNYLVALAFVLVHSPLYSLPFLVKLTLAQTRINQSLLLS